MINDRRSHLIDLQIKEKNIKTALRQIQEEIHIEKERLKVEELEELKINVYQTKQRIEGMGDFYIITEPNEHTNSYIIDNLIECADNNYSITGYKHGLCLYLIENQFIKDAKRMWVFKSKEERDNTLRKLRSNSF